jgi:hypothetical protein
MKRIANRRPISSSPPLRLLVTTRSWHRGRTANVRRYRSGHARPSRTRVWIPGVDVPKGACLGAAGTGNPVPARDSHSCPLSRLHDRHLSSRFRVLRRATPGVEGKALRLRPIGLATRPLSYSNLPARGFATEFRQGELRVQARIPPGLHLSSSGRKTIHPSLGAFQIRFIRCNRFHQARRPPASC